MSQEAGQLESESIRADVMRQARSVAGELPRPQLRSLVCPFCGTVTPDHGRCEGCGGRFDPLSRQATQNQMGPWEIRDDRVPFRPGCSYETLLKLIENGKVTTETVLRGPSTRQFWMLARHTPGVAQHLGMCHSCQGLVRPDAFSCPSCQVPFEVERDRQHLGLGPARPLPGQGLPEVLALRAEPATAEGAGHVSAPIASTAVAHSSGLSTNSSDSMLDSPRTDHSDPTFQSEEARRQIRQWRTRAQRDHRHAWTVIVLASLITISAIAYAVFSRSEWKAASDSSGADSSAVGIDE